MASVGKKNSYTDSKETLKISQIFKTIFEMKVILIQGRKGAGKTTLCNVIKTSLQTKNKEIELLSSNGDDFYHKYTIDNKIIIVVSAGDNNDILDKLEEIFKNNPDCDIFIAVIRPNEKIKNKRLHNRTMDIFTTGGVKSEDISTIDLDKLTKEFIEGEVFNNHFTPIFQTLIK